MTAVPFTIAVPDADVADLHDRLAHIRWPGRVARQAWEDGTDLDYLHDLVDHWRQAFDWRAQEHILNTHPQYLVDVGDLRLHCSVTRSAARVRPPLLLLAGWPSTFFEHYKVVPLLDDFDVVCASLPGFGFSERPTQPGMDTATAGDRLVTMMERLGFPRFAIHATDFGARVATAMALRHPDRVAALHFAAVPGVVASDEDYDRRAARFEDEMGYKVLQSTRPQTLAYGLTDSPVAQAAWIVEKWRSWTDCGGELGRVVTADQLLTTVSIYWFTATGGAAAGLYYEDRLHPITFAPGQRIEVPAGFSVFPHPPQRSRSSAEERFLVSYWRDMPRGGHHPAIEVPDVLAEEIVRSFRQIGYLP